ncbi:unnamed protein product [Symbiodinium sp. KB8]|nr:unnamed protein product [Symbiodinium sp. KB8]
MESACMKPERREALFHELWRSGGTGLEQYAETLAAASPDAPLPSYDAFLAALPPECRQEAEAAVAAFDADAMCKWLKAAKERLAAAGKDVSKWSCGAKDNHVYRTMAQMFGLNPLRFSREQLQELWMVARIAVPLFRKMAPLAATQLQGRFQTMVHQICRLRGWDALAQQFPLLAGKDRLAELEPWQEYVWKELLHTDYFRHDECLPPILRLPRDCPSPTAAEDAALFRRSRALAAAENAKPLDQRRSMAELEAELAAYFEALRAGEEDGSAAALASVDATADDTAPRGQDGHDAASGSASDAVARDDGRGECRSRRSWDAYRGLQGMRKQWSLEQEADGCTFQHGGEKSIPSVDAVRAMAVCAWNTNSDCILDSSSGNGACRRRDNTQDAQSRDAGTLLDVTPSPSNGRPALSEERPARARQTPLPLQPQSQPADDQNALAAARKQEACREPYRQCLERPPAKGCKDLQIVTCTPPPAISPAAFPKTSVAAALTSRLARLARKWPALPSLPPLAVAECLACDDAVSAPSHEEASDTTPAPSPAHLQTGVKGKGASTASSSPLTTVVATSAPAAAGWITTAAVRRQIMRKWPGAMVRAGYLVPHGCRVPLARRRAHVLQPFHVDHVWPRAWGGPDHVDNYVILPAALNMSFGECLCREKMQFLGKAVLARAKALAQALRATPAGSSRVLPQTEPRSSPPAKGMDEGGSQRG